jgi:hypothetical protein
MRHVNEQFYTRVVVHLVALLLLAVVPAPVAAQRSRTSAKKKPVYYTVKAGKTLRVRLNDELDSEKARVGDRFTVTTVDPVYAGGGVEVIPQASTLVGEVTNVKRAGRKGEPATLDVRFVGLRLPNGSRRQLSGSLSELDSSSGTSDNEGTVSAKKTSHRNAKFIGGGAAGGALLGAIAGGGKGALIGGVIGGGTGLVGSRVKKGHEVNVKSGTEFGVILNRSISLTKYKAAQ